MGVGSSKLRIGTRGSELALWQANHLAELLSVPSEIVIINTTGDKDRMTPLKDSGGQGVFTKELEKALLDNEVDVAVHSLKDLPIVQPEGLRLCAILERENPSDCLIYRSDVFDIQKFISDPLTPSLRNGAVIGTSSPRREGIISELDPGLRCKNIRGNLPTRISKLKHGDFDGIILARAGLNRIRPDLSGLRVFEFSSDAFPCSPGQGAIAVQSRQDIDFQLLSEFKKVNSVETEILVNLERDLLLAYGGGCHMPFGAHCKSNPDKTLTLTAWIGENIHKASKEKKAFHGSVHGGSGGLVSEFRKIESNDGPLFGKKILNTRGRKNPDFLTLSLRGLGAEVISEPAFSFELTADAVQKLQMIKSKMSNVQSVLIFSSPFSAELTLRYFESDFEALSNDYDSFLRDLKICVMGQSTARICRNFGVEPLFISSGQGADKMNEEISGFLKNSNMSDACLVFPKSSAAKNHFQKLKAEAFDLYSPVGNSGADKGATLPFFDGVVFYSPSAVKGFFQSYGLECLRDRTSVEVFSIGKTTTSALLGFGIQNINESLGSETKNVIEVIKSSFCEG